MYKQLLLALWTCYKVRNPWLQWREARFLAKYQKSRIFFNFAHFWGQNHQKDAFSAHLTTPKSADTLVEGI